nr:retrovirus-related Pol polyprotein from transposon TNT 1-94 [Tanacetum cinerariifolium]
MRNSSQGKKQEVEDQRRSVKLSKNKTSVTACNDSLIAKTLNVNSIFAMCDKCVLHNKHGYKWKPKFGKENVNPNVSMHLGNASRTANVIDTMTYRRSIVSNTPLSSNYFVAHRDCPIHHLEVVFRKLTCFIRDLKGNDFLTGSHGMDLYSITLQDTNSPNSICLMAKATSSQAWLWHHRLFHLNFDTINLLSKNDIMVGLPKLKFIKDHLCSSYELGKAKQKSFLTKLTPSSKRRLQLLHMDLCGPMRVAKGIHHQTSVARTLEQNGIVERQTRTLVEAARTMLSAAKVPLFFWAKAIATACFTQNRSLIIPRHEKTPYHIINDQKPLVKFFYIFGSICYIVRDGENLNKMKEKGNDCIFMRYSTQSRAYRVCIKRTRVIMESIHVNFDELPHMVSDHISSDPAPECQSMALNHDSLSPAIQRQANVPQEDRTVTTSNELDLLFSPMFDELLNGSSKVVSKSSAVSAADAPNQRQHHTTPLINHTTPAPSCQVPTLAPTVISSKNINQAETYAENDQLADDEFINMFSTLVQDQGETSSRHVDLSNMHTFYQRYPFEHRWTKDHPLEQVIRNPSQSVRTRRQLESDAEMCMFALTVSRTEPKNIKKAMADFAWIESMQEEFHQFDRLDALYGLKQALKAWYDELSKFLLSKGFTKGSIDPTLFITKHKGDILLVQIYVDDIIFGSTNPNLSKRFEKLMHSKFEMSMMRELKFFLGIQIHQSPRGIFINQAKYAQEILKKHGMTSCDSIGTSMATKHLDADLSGSPVDQTKYRSKVEDLMYLTASRPDIVHATCYCARYQAQPTEKHLTTVKWIFRYLKDTIHVGLWYPKDTGFKLTAFSYSDHAGCLDSRKSTSGGIQFLGGDKLVSWSSKKQDSIAISCNPVQHSRTKHIDVRYHFIKEKVEKGIVELFFVGTEYQLADLFTKALPIERFKYLVR